MVLIEGIERMVEEELIRARREHQANFNSSNEALGVLLEEIEEAEYEWKDIKKAFDDFKLGVYGDDDEYQYKYASELYSSAVRCCAELIQVSAMAKKAMARTRREK